MRKAINLKPNVPGMFFAGFVPQVAAKSAIATTDATGAKIFTDLFIEEHSSSVLERVRLRGYPDAIVVDVDVKFLVDYA